VSHFFLINYFYRFYHDLTSVSHLFEITISDRDAIITRSDGENLALIATDELASLIETVYLLRSRVDYL
ncbi:hypothetical protein QUA57_21240, partial [Microcoleus sp. Pol7_B2]